MENERTMRIEEIEKGKQGMQEKLSQVTKMVTILIKGKGLLRIPVHEIGLYLGKIMTINSLYQTRTTFVNKKKVKEKFVWTVKTHQRVAKMQPPGQ